MVEVPDGALPHGFSNARGGAVTSRTLMLAELRRLLVVAPALATTDDLRHAVVEENALMKPTRDTRAVSFRYLRDRYALDPRVTVYRALRELWDEDGVAQPLLALLSASTRDPLIRATAPTVLPATVGAMLPPEALAAAITAAFPDSYGPGTLIETARRLASSWQQAGHLSGRANKVRAQATSRPTAVAYALLLGHLCGARGEGLFQTLWTQLLDAPGHTVRDQAAEASRLGWIEYRQAGAVTEVGFRHLLREREGGGVRA